MTIDVICPLYNAEEYIVNMYRSLKKQEDVDIHKIKFILTESKDKSEEILKENNIEYELIKREEFSHSLTREKAAMESESDIIVFITQDVIIEDKNWLYNLTKNIGKNKIAAAYSRQITKYNNIEKYTRECNYPEKSFTVSKNDINNLGLKTFFFSDASGALDAKVFKKLKGYDAKKLPISEDMYYAYKLITNGYKINYEADSIVYRSHKFTLKQLYDRYKLTGKFFKENSYLDQYGTNDSGIKLAKYTLQRSIKEGNIKSLFRWLPDMVARYLGMKAGKKKNA